MAQNMPSAQGMATQRDNYSRTQNSKAQVSHTQNQLNEVTIKMQGKKKKQLHQQMCFKKPERFLQKSRYKQYAKLHMFMLVLSFKKCATHFVQIYDYENCRFSE